MVCCCVDFIEVDVFVHSKLDAIGVAIELMFVRCPNEI